MPIRIHSYAAAFAAVSWLAVFSGSSWGAAQSSPALTDLSLEELMNIQVVSGSKKLQRVADSASAVFVITAEDIRRSGATSLPEALRMAPGVEVARFGSHKWAVSIRGFNGRFANKLLVLMDGRSVYTPLFGGVFWEMQDVVMEDVERIEVVRGPGASLWGANAVNGVINIITKHAKDTRGGLASAGAGNVERGFGTVRFGGALGDDGAYRVYAKGFARDRFPDASGNAGRDDFNAGMAGFRLDRALAGGSELMVQGGVSRSVIGERVVIGQVAAPYLSVQDIDEQTKGAHLLVRWESGDSSGSTTSLQAYVAGTEFRFGQQNDRQRTVDLEFQQRAPVGAAHDLVYGLGYRYSGDDMQVSDFLQVNPVSRSTNLWSAFLQDEITLLPQELRLTLGARLEHNDHTGREVQPNARLLWTPMPTQSFWATVARAVRTPSRLEDDIRVRLQVLPPLTAANPGPLPAEVSFVGNRAFDSERLQSFELGYRGQWTPRLSVDGSIFNHRYSQLRSFSPGVPQPQLLAVPPYVLSPVITRNNGSGHVRGVELSVEFRPTAWWRLVGLAGNQRMRLQNDVTATGHSPQHTYSLRSSMSIGARAEFDLWWRHVGALSAIAVPAYTTLDARLGWKVSRTLDVALVGQNLLDRRHQEYVSDFVGTATYQVPRGAYVKVDWKF